MTFPDLGGLRDFVRSKGDSAAVLVGGGLGYVADAGLDVANFMEAGPTGLAAAALTLGAKNMVDLVSARRRRRRRAQRLLDRAADVVERLTERSRLDDAERLKDEIELSKAGTTTSEDLEVALEAGLAAYREA